MAKTLNRCLQCREGEHSDCEIAMDQGDDVFSCECPCREEFEPRFVPSRSLCGEGWTDSDNPCSNCGASPLVAGDATREPEEVEDSGAIVGYCILAVLVLLVVAGLVAAFGPGVAEALR